MSNGFWIPTKPYTLIDAVNRMAAATGSTFRARAAQSADYNGHPLSLYWNDYRQYYVGEYWWADRNVITRGHTTLEGALPIMIEAYDQGGKGTSLIVRPRVDTTQVIRDAIYEAETALAQSGALVAELVTPCARDWAFAASHPRLQAHSEEIEKEHWATWADARFDVVGEAMIWQKNLGVPLDLLLNSTSAEDWKIRRDAFLAARRAR